MTIHLDENQSSALRKSLLTTLSEADLLKALRSMPDLLLRDAGTVTRDVDAVTQLSIDTKSIDIANRSARFIASTDALDSYDESVEQIWDFTRYDVNPVVLYNHQRFASELPIGTAKTMMVNGHLECVITFASERANPFAENVWRCVQEGVLRAVSVGFKPKEVRREIRNEKEIYVLSQNILFEISVTPIGANPEALAKSKAALKAHRTEFDRIVRDDLGPTPATRSAGPAPKTAPKGAPQENASMSLTAEQLQKIADDRLAENTTLKNAATEHNTTLTKLANEKAALENKVVVLDGGVNGALAKLKSVGGVVLDGSKSVVDQLITGLDKLIELHAGLFATNEKLADENIKAEVDKLVGVKISEAEREEFTELRKSNPKLFERMVAKRAASGVLAGTPEDKTVAPGTTTERTKMGADPQPVSSLPAITGDKGAGLAGFLEKSLDASEHGATAGGETTMHELLNG